MAWGGNDRGPTLLVVTWVFTGLSLSTVLLRLLSRLVLTKNAGLDDGLITIAFLVNLAYAIAITDGVVQGYGKHTSELNPTSLPSLGHNLIIQASIGVVTYSVPKLGIVALLNRLLNPSKARAAVLWFLAISCTFVSLLLAIFWYVQCTPRAHQWNPVGIPGTCWNPLVVQNLSFFSVAYSAFLDIVFAIYPSFIIFRLNMHMRKRVVISLALSGGLIAAACAIYKATLVPETESAAGHLDATYTTVPIILFTMVEASILVIIANLPTIGPSLREARDAYTKVRSLFTGRYKTSHTQSSDGFDTPIHKRTSRKGEVSQILYTKSHCDADVPLTTAAGRGASAAENQQNLDGNKIYRVVQMTMEDNV